MGNLSVCTFYLCSARATSFFNSILAIINISMLDRRIGSSSTMFVIGHDGSICKPSGAGWCPTLLSSSMPGTCWCRDHHHRQPFKLGGLGPTHVRRVNRGPIITRGGEGGWEDEHLGILWWWSISAFKHDPPAGALLLLMGVDELLLLPGTHWWQEPQKTITIETGTTKDLFERGEEEEKRLFHPYFVRHVCGRCLYSRWLLFFFLFRTVNHLYIYRQHIMRKLQPFYRRATYI